MAHTTLNSRNVFIYFLIGILTGAIVVLATIMIQNLAKNSQADLLRYEVPSRTYEESYGTLDTYEDSLYDDRLLLERATLDNTFDESSYYEMGGQPNMPTDERSIYEMGGQPN